MNVSHFPLLLNEVRNESPGSLEILLAHTRHFILPYLSRLSGNEGLAEDLAQETLLKVTSAVHAFEGDKFLAWVKRIAFNLFVDYVRVKRNQAYDELKDSHSMSPNAVIEQFEVRRGLSQLSQGEQKTVLLVDHYGYSYEDAATIMGCSPDALRSRLSRARKALRENLAA